MRSIRSQLVVHSLGRLLPLLVLGCATLYVAVRVVLISEFDSALTSQAHVLASTTERVGSGVDFDYDSAFMPEFATSVRPAYFQFWLSDGNVLDRSQALLLADLAPAPEPDKPETVRAITLPDGRPGRACVLVFEPRPVPIEQHKGDVKRPTAPAGPVRLMMAKGIEEIERPLRVLSIALVCVGAALLVGITLVMRSSVRYGLRPVDVLAERVIGVDVARLQERLNVSDLPRELRPIAACLNELLAKLEAAFDRERRFTANAAHELRTPIAELRTMTEVAMKWPGSTEDQARTIAEVGQIAEEMEHTVAAMLEITRAKGSRQRVAPTLIDVSAMARELWEKRAERAQAKSLAIEFDAAPGLWIETQQSMLASAVSNLLDNAVSHAPDGGLVRVICQPEGNGVRVCVQNTNDSLVSQDLDRIFDPFWRKDAARSDHGHSGLGLALVRSLSEALGAKVWASLSPDGIFSITIRVPGVIRRGPGPGDSQALADPALAGAKR